MLRDSEALNLLEQRPRYLGWTQEQWARIAAQFPEGQFRPTLDDAFQIRRDWLNSSNTLDTSKRDDTFAAELFYNVARAEYEQGLMLTQDRAKGCG